MSYKLVFDEVIFRQLKRLDTNESLKNILSKLFDKLEMLGPRAGNLLDSQLRLYEMKMKHPPIRVYFKHNVMSDEIYLFEFEMKTSKGKQRKTIDKLRKKRLES